ncbi:hypothetical protein OTB20_17195 [Streptomyces sp. H27-H1]|uniref:hypothetical protein n=1 Tax=Streptomyces sp. H27-H1 TaxID=2996461 RepID=UPI00226F2D07|nr:hypothetical protein [Streptomyces sp. H27-H1]MCY0927917.1 hypothetical protein [Streptomyces sp. H27-H1]
MAISQRWRLRGTVSDGYTGQEARTLLVHRLDWASNETWFEDGQGQLLSVITNGERAVVALLDHARDPGEHLVDPKSKGDSGGYAMSNGQIDTYLNRDTVPFPVACRAVAHFIEHGLWPHDVAVEDDRSSGSRRPASARDCR